MLFERQQCDTGLAVGCGRLRAPARPPCIAKLLVRRNAALAFQHRKRAIDGDL